MKQKLVLMLTLTLLIGILSVAFDVQEANASGTIYIRADGSIDPPTALITTVDSVTYTFIDNINGSIVVERDNIVIDGAGYMLQGPGNIGTGILIYKINNVTIKDMRIKGFEYGVDLVVSSNNTISGNNITKNVIGIYLEPSQDNIISGNDIIGNGYTGIKLIESTGNTISDNKITSNDIGIRLNDSPKNIFCKNSMATNRYNFGVYASFPENYFNSIDTSNTVDGKPIFYWVNERDMTIPFDAGYVALVNCTRITVKNLNITSNMQGILLVLTKNSTVTDNRMTNNIVGIFLDYSFYNTISRNNSTENLERGIWLIDSYQNDVRENINARNEIGIQLHFSSNNRISANNVTMNNYSGIDLVESSHNIISGNYIALNNLYGLSMFESDNNRIFHNNFREKNRYCSHAATYSSHGNLWDDGYPSGGNYWSDYTGDDLDYDGIGDSWHEIDADNIDNYPLMGMFSDFNATSEHHVQTICNSTITDFQFNGTAIGFHISGENDTTGFCRICIPTALMNTTYKVFVNGTEVSHNLLPCSNETYSYLYFNYTHSTQGVIIIPEFSSFLILPLFMTLTLLTVIICKRRHTRRSCSTSF